MPTELFTRELKSEPLTVITAQSLSKIEINAYQITGTYVELKKLSDGTTLPAQNFMVSRSRATIRQDVADWIAQGATFIELWRQQDEDERTVEKAAADAEAIRWAALTPEEQKAEVEAARAARQAAIDAAPLQDPAPQGAIP